MTNTCMRLGTCLRHESEAKAMQTKECVVSVSMKPIVVAGRGWGSGSRVQCQNRAALQRAEDSSVKSIAFVCTYLCDATHHVQFVIALCQQFQLAGRMRDRCQRQCREGRDSLVRIRIVCKRTSRIPSPLKEWFGGSKICTNGENSLKDARLPSSCLVTAVASALPKENSTLDVATFPMYSTSSTRPSVETVVGTR